MGIMLGDLSIEQIERRLGIALTADEKKRLVDTHQAKAEGIKGGKWHCFDIPFVLVCGNYDFAKEVCEIFTPYAGNMTQQLQIALER